MSLELALKKLNAQREKQKLKEIEKEKRQHKRELKKKKEEKARKKRKQKVKKSRKSPYRLILLSNNREVASLGHYTNYNDAIKDMHQKSQDSINTVKFPKFYLNCKKIEEANYELLLIKKKDDENEKSDALLRDKLGGFVLHETDNKVFSIIEKAPYYVEEEFAVYGYHPITQRKNFDFIFENLVLPKTISKDDMLNIMVYRNKLILEGFKKTDLVTCKNKSDCIRLYNKIAELCKQKRECRYYGLNGDMDRTSYSKEIAVEKIMKLTNWDKLRIIRNKTKTQDGSRSKTKKEE